MNVDSTAEAALNSFETEFPKVVDAKLVEGPLKKGLIGREHTSRSHDVAARKLHDLGDILTSIAAA